MVISIDVRGPSSGSPFWSRPTRPVAPLLCRLVYRKGSFSFINSQYSSQELSCEHRAVSGPPGRTRRLPRAGHRPVCDLPGPGRWLHDEACDAAMFLVGSSAISRVEAGGNARRPGTLRCSSMARLRSPGSRPVAARGGLRRCDVPRLACCALPRSRPVAARRSRRCFDVRDDVQRQREAGIPRRRPCDRLASSDAPAASPVSFHPPVAEPGQRMHHHRARCTDSGAASVGVRAASSLGSRRVILPRGEAAPMRAARRRERSCMDCSSALAGWPLSACQTAGR